MSEAYGLTYGTTTDANEVRGYTTNTSKGYTYPYTVTAEDWLPKNWTLNQPFKLEDKDKKIKELEEEVKDLQKKINRDKPKKKRPEPVPEEPKQGDNELDKLREKLWGVMTDGR